MNFLSITTFQSFRRVCLQFCYCCRGSLRPSGTPPIPLCDTPQCGGTRQGRRTNTIHRKVLTSSSVFCIAKYRGGVRRTEGLENTDRGDDRFRSPLPLLIVDEIGGSARRARELKKILAEKETEADINLSPAVSRSVTGSYVSNIGETPKIR